MFALEVKNLTKKYPAFTLDRANFSVEEGKIVGLVGRNGAGKTTVLRSILNLVHAEGEVKICGVPVRQAERKAKALVGFAGGGFRFYPQKRVDTVAKAVSSLYENWDEARFQRLLKQYGIAKEKKISALSEGMKAKLFVALALSHGAKLLLLDEPTSGLDPVSREEFCDLLLHAVQSEGASVLFSTHITSDLDRVADDIVYLCEGKVLFSEPLSALQSRYCVKRFASREEARGAIGVKRIKDGFEGLVNADEAEQAQAAASLDEIIVHLEEEQRIKRERDHV